MAIGFHESEVPKKMAEEIQNNVEQLKDDPKNEEALTALREDAGILSASPNSFRQKVQSELYKMEADGKLPLVTIDRDGNLISGIIMPGKFDENGEPVSKQRAILIEPDNSIVSDNSVLDKGKLSKQALEMSL